MKTKNTIQTTWKGGMLLESENPSGNTLLIDDGSTEEKAYKPKALMLSSLAGCSGLDIASLVEKMRVVIDDFKIDITAELTDEHPKYYDNVLVEYHFYGNSLDEKKLTKIVNLSVDKYCGVMAMFKQFASVTVKNYFHTK